MSVSRHRQQQYERGNPGGNRHKGGAAPGGGNTTHRSSSKFPPPGNAHNDTEYDSDGQQAKHQDTATQTEGTGVPDLPKELMEKLAESIERQKLDMESQFSADDLNNIYDGVCPGIYDLDDCEDFIKKEDEDEDSVGIDICKKHAKIGWLIYASFQKIDADNDGFITANEIRDIMEPLHPLSEAQITAMMTEADKDRDEKLDLEEFRDVMLPYAV